MAHHPKPWYRKSRRVWYVQIDGKQHTWGPTARKPLSNNSGMSGNSRISRFVVKIRHSITAMLPCLPTAPGSRWLDNAFSVEPTSETIAVKDAAILTLAMVGQISCETPDLT